VKAGEKQNNPPAGNPRLYRKQKVSARVELSSHWLVRSTERYERSNRRQEAEEVVPEKRIVSLLQKPIIVAFNS
jgi:hypothetical protein